MKRLAVCLIWIGLFGVTSAVEAAIADGIRRERVAGIDLVVFVAPGRDVVSIIGALPAGHAFAADGSLAVPQLTATLAQRGRTHVAPRKALRDSGASLDISTLAQDVRIRGRALRQDLPLLLELLATQLRDPAFDSDEFEAARRELERGAQGSDWAQAVSAASDAFESAVFPAGHPSRTPTAAELAGAAAHATLEDVTAFHRKHYGPAHMTLVVAGSVEVEFVTSLVERHFAGWTGGVDYMRSSRRSPAPRSGCEIAIQVPQQASTSVMLGQATGLRAAEPEALALSVGTHVLGSGATSRLFKVVRDEEGLTYRIAAGLDAWPFADGAWKIWTGFAPELLDRGVTVVRRELRTWWRDGITNAELARAKRTLIGKHELRLATLEGIAYALFDGIVTHGDVAWPDTLPRRIEAVTLAQVNGAIRTYLDPDAMVLVKAGTVSGVRRGEPRGLSPCSGPL
jgi:zinc protease